MNKHQLASTIWESANQMRSKIEANEYKDFILGFIFYKYLSERELDLFQRKSSVKMKSRRLTKRTSSMRNTCGRHLGILLPMTICSQHGWQREMILM